jgi:hypothetical protein
MPVTPYQMQGATDTTFNATAFVTPPEHMQHEQQNLPPTDDPMGTAAGDNDQLQNHPDEEITEKETEQQNDEEMASQSDRPTTETADPSASTHSDTASRSSPHTQ